MEDQESGGSVVISDLSRYDEIERAEREEKQVRTQARKETVIFAAKSVLWIPVTIGLVLISLLLLTTDIGKALFSLIIAFFILVGIPLAIILVILFGIIFLIVWMVKSSSKIIK